MARSDTKIVTVKAFASGVVRLLGHNRAYLFEKSRWPVDLPIPNTLDPSGAQRSA